MSKAYYFCLVQLNEDREIMIHMHAPLPPSISRIRYSLFIIKSLIIIIYPALQPTKRSKITFERRVGIAVGELAVGPTFHLNNADEANVPDFAGQFHNSLLHDQFGQAR